MSPSLPRRPADLARKTLEAIFRPRTIAVIGATDHPASAGRSILLNLAAERFDGLLYPVAPGRSTIIGLPAYHDIASVPEDIDVAIIASPAREVPDEVERCAAAGVGATIIVSGGFGETGRAGADLQARIAATAHRTGMRVLGPNSLGLVVPAHGLNASTGPGMPRAGGIAFLSESGAVCSAILDQGLGAGVGFSAFVSVGAMADIGWADLIEWFGDDPRTKAILISMESLGDAKRFLSAAREVALTKPIVVLKGGRSASGARAALTHTGAITGSDVAVDAVFDRAGVLRVETLEELFSLADVLAKQPRPRGPRLGIVGNGGGPGVIAADAASRAGASVAELSAETVAKLDAALPEHWSRANPIDLLGDAGPERYVAALEALARDDGVDGVLALLAPQDSTDALRIAQGVAEAATRLGKPLLACWMGGARVRPGRDALNAAGIPVFAHPEEAARAFAAMHAHAETLAQLHETPSLSDDDDAPDTALADSIVAAARRSDGLLLAEHEAKSVLAAWRIPVIATRVVETVAQAVAAADRIGYPVALKLRSSTISHRGEVGGVALWLHDGASVANAFDRIHAAASRAGGADAFSGVVVEAMASSPGAHALLACVRDRDVGPLIAFGFGGEYGDLSGDIAYALPPLTTTLARRLVLRTRIGRALSGRVGLGQRDLDELDRVVVRFSRLVVQQPWLRELEINPLLVGRGAVVALDARGAVDGADVREPCTPIVRPYPTQYVHPWTSPSHGAFVVRPIRPEDEPLMRAFHEGLSERTVTQRWFQPLSLRQRTAHDRLVRVCFGDYDRDLALVVDRRDATTGEHAIVAVGRLSRDRRDAGLAEMAIVVQDAWQASGIGFHLVGSLIDAARAEAIRRLTAYIMPFNRAMQELCGEHGFAIAATADDSVAVATLDLAAAAAI